MIFFFKFHYDTLTLTKRALWTEYQDSISHKEGWHFVLLKGYRMMNNSVEKRSEPRTEPEKYHSVEFQIADLDLLYQFKLWNMSSKGMCLLVRDDSDVLKYLEVGNVLDMKFYTTDFTLPPENLKIQIKHITKDDQGRFKGHYLVGLLVLEKRQNRT